MEKTETSTECQTLCADDANNDTGAAEMAIDKTATEMTIDKVAAELAGIIPEERLVRQADMSRYTSFRAGGPAALLATVDTAEELSGALKAVSALGLANTNSSALHKGTALLCESDASVVGGKEENTSDGAEKANDQHKGMTLLCESDASVVGGKEENTSDGAEKANSLHKGMTLLCESDASIADGKEEKISEAAEKVNTGVDMGVGSPAALEYMILGNGSNVLVQDGGYPGLIIRIGSGLAGVRLAETEHRQSEDLCTLADCPAGMKNTKHQASCPAESCHQDSEDAQDLVLLQVGAATLLSEVAAFALRNSLTGFEFASGIPGTMGGGVFMNAGAYGGEMKDVLVSARVMDSWGNIRELSCQELELGYRTSLLKSSGDTVIEATLALRPGDPEAIRAEMEDLKNRRNTKQPVAYPSAGSFFKRPTGHYAGALIQEAGLKGTSIGGAMVSQLHAGFIINTGGARARDIVQLMHLVQNTVYDRSGVLLEPEVRIVGLPLAEK